MTTAYHTNKQTENKRNDDCVRMYIRMQAAATFMIVVVKVYYIVV